MNNKSERFVHRTAAESAARERVLLNWLLGLILALVLVPAAIMTAVVMDWLNSNLLWLATVSLVVFTLCALVVSGRYEYECELGAEGYDEAAKLAASAPRVAELLRQWTATDVRLSEIDLRYLRRAAAPPRGDAAADDRVEAAKAAMRASVQHSR